MNNLTEQVSQSITECGLKIITWIYLIVIYVIAVLGNTIIVTVAVFHSEFRKGGILPMFTLAICDLIFIQVAIMTFLLNMSSKLFLKFSTENCAFTAMFGTSMASFVVYHHGILALTRFTAVCNPIRYKTLFTTKRTAIMISCVIVIVFSITIISYLLPSPRNSFMGPYYNPSMLCCIYSGRWQVMAFNMIVIYVPPLNIASYCYVKCIHHLRFKKNDSKPLDILHRKQYRLAYTMLINYAIVNINCCLYPVAILLGGDDVSSCNYWKRFLSYMVLHNSTVSPIVYLILSKNIRQKAIRIFSLNRIHKVNNNIVLPTNS